MLLSQLLSGILSPLFLIIWLITLTLSITIHEFSHAFVANRLGDPTAKHLGRLSLNPLRHLDPIGTIALLLIGIGWGKPVPFNPSNLQNPKIGSAIISAAGPISNILLAVILSLPYLIIVILLKNTTNLESIVNIYSYIILAVWLNVSLAIFNLIPVHPLDGFKILGGFLPTSWYYDWQRMEPYGMFILLLLIIPLQGSSLVSRIILPVAEKVTGVLLPHLDTLLLLTH